jgi:hypothetical protein
MPALMKEYIFLFPGKRIIIFSLYSLNILGSTLGARDRDKIRIGLELNTTYFAYKKYSGLINFNFFHGSIISTDSK